MFWENDIYFEIYYLKYWGDEEQKQASNDPIFVFSGNQEGVSWDQHFYGICNFLGEPYQ